MVKGAKEDDEALRGHGRKGGYKKRMAGTDRIVWASITKIYSIPLLSLNFM